MSISVTCQACGADFRVSDRHAGKRFACRNCRAPLTVPQLDELGLAELDDAPAARATTEESRAPASVPRSTAERPREPAGGKAPAAFTPRPNPGAAERAPPREAASSAAPGQIVAACDGCGHRTTVGADLVGRRVRCKTCGQVFRIPAAANPDLAALAASAPQPARSAPPRPAPPRMATPQPPAPRPAPQPLRPPAAAIQPPAARPTVTGTPALTAQASAPPNDLLDLLGSVDEASLPALAPTSPRPAPAAPVALKPLAKAPRRSRPWWDRFTSRRPSGPEMTGGGIILTIVIILFRVGMRMEPVRNWLSDNLGGIGARSDSPGTRVVELSRQNLESGRQFLTLLTGIHDVTSARTAAPQFAELLSRMLSADEEGERLGVQRMTKSQADELAKMKAEGNALIPQISQQGDRIRQIPGVSEALLAGLSADLRAKLAGKGIDVWRSPLADSFSNPSAPPGAPPPIAPRSNAPPGTTNTLPFAGSSSGPSSPGDSGQPSRPSLPRKPTPTLPPAEIVEQALSDLRSGDTHRYTDAARELQKIEPTIRRDEVAKALLKALDDGDTHWRSELIDALAIWGTADCVPSLINLLDDHGFDSEHAVKALGKLKDPRGARAVAKLLLTWDARKAVAALRDMGPVAEDAVLQYLRHDDPKMRLEMCRLLEDIGTTKCIPEVRRRLSDNSKPVRDAAKAALPVIQARGAAPYTAPSEGDADPFRTDPTAPDRPASKSEPAAPPDDNPFREQTEPPPAGKPSSGKPSTKSEVPKALKPVPR